MIAVETAKSEACQRSAPTSVEERHIRQPSKSKPFTSRVLKVAITYNEMSKGMEKELTKMTREQTPEPTLSKELATLAKIKSATSSVCKKLCSYLLGLWLVFDETKAHIRLFCTFINCLVCKTKETYL